jgi:carbon starvation protein CstA
MKSEKMGRPIFYGAMITEGLVALIWATVAMYFFYNEPTPGYQEMAGGEDVIGKAPGIVNLICENWLGVFGSILAILGVVAAPITSGDTALRSARLIIAEFIHLDQKTIQKRMWICIPLFGVTMLLLFYNIENPDGFNVIWSWFGWSNQTLAVFTLWAITVYLVREQKPYWVTLLPALFMTVVCSSFFMVSKNSLGLDIMVGYGVGGAALIIAVAWFFTWKSKIAKS